jgi:hypothetical protein
MQPVANQWQLPSVAALLQPPDAASPMHLHATPAPPCTAGPHLLSCLVLSPPSPRPQKLSVDTQATQLVLCRVPVGMLPSYVSAIPRIYRPCTSLLQVCATAGRMGACPCCGAGCYGCHLCSLVCSSWPCEALLAELLFRHVAGSLQVAAAKAAPPWCATPLHWCCWVFTSS